MAKQFLRLKQIIGTRDCPRRVPISKSSWWAGIKNGRFPQPIKLGPKTTIWDEADIDALGQEEKMTLIIITIEMLIEKILFSLNKSPFYLFSFPSLITEPR